MPKSVVTFLKRVQGNFIFTRCVKYLPRTERTSSPAMRETRFPLGDGTAEWLPHNSSTLRGSWQHFIGLWLQKAIMQKMKSSPTTCTIIHLYPFPISIFCLCGRTTSLCLKESLWSPILRRGSPEETGCFVQVSHYFTVTSLSLEQLRHLTVTFPVSAAAAAGKRGKRQKIKTKQATLKRRR